MVGPNGLEPSTSSVSRKRSNQTELRAYVGTTFQFYGRRAIPATLGSPKDGKSRTYKKLVAPKAMTRQFNEPESVTGTAGRSGRGPVRLSTLGDSRVQSCRESGKGRSGSGPA
jgi:hypothetical protein